MATRSAILVQTSPSSYVGVYCHNDGYPDGVGATLAAHYDTYDKAMALVSLGDLSQVNPNLEPPLDGHTFDTPVSGVTIAYGRDRGESGTGPKKGRSLSAILSKIDHQYAYLFKDGIWCIAVFDYKTDKTGKFVALAEFEA